MWDARGLLSFSLGRYDDAAVSQGRVAYAHEQAAMYRCMERQFAHLWRYVPQYVLLGQGIIIPEDVERAEEADNDI